MISLICLCTRVIYWRLERVNIPFTFLESRGIYREMNPSSLSFLGWFLVGSLSVA